MSEFGLVIIGAHIGIHINKDLEEYKNQKVILIEPVPHNLKALKTNTFSTFLVFKPSRPPLMHINLIFDVESDPKVTQSHRHIPKMAPK